MTTAMTIPVLIILILEIIYLSNLTKKL